VSSAHLQQAAIQPDLDHHRARSGCECYEKSEIRVRTVMSGSRRLAWLDEAGAAASARWFFERPNTSTSKTPTAHRPTQGRTPIDIIDPAHKMRPENES
jgi:hypothetical protein